MLPAVALAKAGRFATKELPLASHSLPRLHVADLIALPRRRPVSKISPHSQRFESGLSPVEQPDRVFRCRRTQVHVALRRRQVRVSGHLLDGPRRRALHRQVRTERVPQDVHALLDTGDALSATDGL